MNDLQVIYEELKKPKSKRRKKVIKLITSELISEIESEIIRIDLFLTTIIIKNISKKEIFQPSTNDEYQPLRDKLKYLRELRSKL